MQVLGVQVQVSGAQQAQQALGQTASKLDKFKAGLSKANTAATVAMGAVVAFAKRAGDAASEVQQSYGGLESVFGGRANVVKQWAEEAADSVGLARDEYATAAAKIGAQLKNMGYATKPAASATKQLITLGADLAATFGGTTQEAVDALGAALRGEADPAERYGLALKQTNINAVLAARGQDKLKGSALAQAKAQALVELATKQAGGAIGQFAREADTAAGAQQRANATWRNAEADIGKALLPIMRTLGEWIQKISKWVSENSGLVKTLGVVVLGAAAAIKVLNAAMRASPLALIITLVAAMAAGIVALWKKSETFRRIVTGVWNAVKTAAQTAWRIIRTVIETVIRVVSGAVRGFGRAVGAVWSGIRAAARTVWGVISGIITGVVDTVKTIWNGIKAFFTGLWNGVKSAVSAPWKAIGGVITAVVGTVKTVWNGIAGFFSGLWSGITKVAGGAWSLISTVIGAARSVVEGIWNGITGFFGGLWEGIKGAASSAAGWIADRMRDAIGWIKQAWDWLTKTEVKGRAVPVPGYHGSMAALAAGGGVTASGPVNYYPGASVTINVSGAGSPDRVARSIERVLTERARRIGGVQI